MTHALARTQRVAAGSVLALLLISHLLIIVPPKPIDDAYITYRYADNLAHGMGFVYNAGERVLGTSSPLYTLLLAAGAVARISIPWFSVVLEAASILAIGALVILLFRAAGQIWPGIAAVAVAAVVLRRYLFDAIAMETALYTAGALGALVALRWRRFGVAAALAGPVALLRPEGFLIGIPLILSLAEHRREWWPPRRSLIAAVLFSGAVVALWTLFAALWFGSVIPQSAVAKSLQSARAGWPSFGRAVVTNILFDGKTVLPIALVAVAGPVFALLRDRQSWPLWLWLALHTGFFTLTGAPFYRWYFFPIFIGLVIATGYTMWAAHDVVARLMRSPWPLAAGCLVTLCLVRDFRIGVLTSLDDWSSAAAYERMGPWLRDHTPPDGRVAASEIGVLGFTSGRRVIDLMGLVTPVAVELRTQRRGGDLPMQFLPDYLVYPDVNRARTPRETLGEMFFETYAEVHSESIVSLLPEEQRTIAHRLRQFRPARAVIGADLDGDGAEELIETRAEDPSSLWVRWKADGAWVPLALPDLGRCPGSPGALVRGDLNGDGCDEIVLGVPGASPAGRLFAGEISLGAPACADRNRLRTRRSSAARMWPMASDGRSPAAISMVMVAMTSRRELPAPPRSATGAFRRAKSGGSGAAP